MPGRLVDQRVQRVVGEVVDVDEAEVRGDGGAGGGEAAEDAQGAALVGDFAGFGHFFLGGEPNGACAASGPLIKWFDRWGDREHLIDAIDQFAARKGRSTT